MSRNLRRRVVSRISFGMEGLEERALLSGIGSLDLGHDAAVAAQINVESNDGSHDSTDDHGHHKRDHQNHHHEHHNGHH